MRNKLIEGVEAPHHRKEPLVFEIGDTVTVGVRIKEGGKTRVQPFIGVVIARRGASTNATFTVRRIVNNEGVERIFALHSPNIVGVEVMRHGKVRRGKLYFLRDRVGKAQKLKERRPHKSSSKAAGRGRGGDGGGSKAKRMPAAGDSGDAAKPENAEVAATV